MPMLVVRIRHMRVGVGARRVDVRVAVRAGEHGRVVVVVVVVTIVVPVGVLVVQRLVRVRVAVRFCQVQQHAERQHEGPVGKQFAEKDGPARDRVEEERLERPVLQLPLKALRRRHGSGKRQRCPQGSGGGVLERPFLRPKRERQNDDDQTGKKRRSDDDLFAPQLEL